MRYQHIIQAVYGEPWLITPGAHASIRQIVKAHLLDVHMQREGTDVCGGEVDLQQMEIVDGVAHIPVAGVIGRGLSKMEKGSGCVDVMDISDELGTAEADDSVNTIILDFDSPGGMSNGTPELADQIAACPKPIYAFCAGQCCSAAYWLASSCDAICATQSADIGSIGVYIPWVDETAAYEAAGLKVELIKAGTLKGTGFPGTELTKEQRAYLQDRVDGLYSMFAMSVLKHRPEVANETMQGQSFIAGDAAKRGLVDHIVTSRKQMMESLGI